MVLHPLAAVETGGAGGFDDGLGVPVIGVSKDFGEVPAGPEFVARRICSKGVMSLLMNELVNRE